MYNRAQQICSARRALGGFGVARPGVNGVKLTTSTASENMALLRLLVLLLAAASRPSGTSATRGIRWAVNEPAAVAPWLLHGAAWANSSRSVSSATVGIVVLPVFSVNTSGMITASYPDKLLDGSLSAYATAGHDIILDIGPWVGTVGGFVDRSGGYAGPTLAGLNCSSLTTQKEAAEKNCVTPDSIIRAALARKEAFAAEFLALLKESGATGFGTDWETCTCTHAIPNTT